MPARKHIPVPITEPIDFPALAEAYRATRWRWNKSHYPNADQISEAIVSLKADYASFYNGTLESGGIVLSRNDYGTVVSIHPRLAAHYKPNAENQQTKGNNYGKIQ